MSVLQASASTRGDIKIQLKNPISEAQGDKSILSMEELCQVLHILMLLTLMFKEYTVESIHFPGSEAKSRLLLITSNVLILTLCLCPGSFFLTMMAKPCLLPWGINIFQVSLELVQIAIKVIIDKSLGVVSLLEQDTIKNNSQSIRDKKKKILLIL